MLSKKHQRKWTQVTLNRKSNEHNHRQTLIKNDVNWFGTGDHRLVKVKLDINTYVVIITLQQRKHENKKIKQQLINLKPKVINIEDLNRILK